MEDKRIIERLEEIEGRVEELEGDYEDVPPPGTKEKAVIKILNGEDLVEIAQDLDLTPGRISQIKSELKNRLE